ncbi:hypothetical protein SKAU_G00118990 [Synaphobranchus kaupii]|uniref:Uncharacterized protein n=1 Tax=Synaphobranchus kaupii TaxID=118154 RepID=A0A9Q1FNY5_SYNKA|nr:hypothetical protein SKAU_G00118990 [Synaphobranchus kaupii]
MLALVSTSLTQLFPKFPRILSAFGAARRTTGHLRDPQPFIRRSRNDSGRSFLKTLSLFASRQRGRKRGVHGDVLTALH